MLTIPFELAALPRCNLSPGVIRLLLDTFYVHNRDGRLSITSVRDATSPPSMGVLQLEGSHRWNAAPLWMDLIQQSLPVAPAYTFVLHCQSFFYSTEKNDSTITTTTASLFNFEDKQSDYISQDFWTYHLIRKRFPWHLWSC